MSASERSRGGGFRSAFEILWGVLTLAVIVVVAWPHIKSTIGALPIGVTWTQATDVPGSKPFSTVLPSGSGASSITISNPAVPAVNVEATSAAYNATEQARILPETQPNVDNTNDSAPVVRGQKENVIEPSNGIVPTAEPIQQTQSDGAFGSKSKPVNIQETHTCLHAQIWTDRGCKNPTPTN
jgi:hypothetical protein